MAAFSCGLIKSAATPRRDELAGASVSRLVAVKVLEVVLCCADLRNSYSIGNYLSMSAATCSSGAALLRARVAQCDRAA